jgi:transcriptional regulator with AAA-type ATPase domain
VRTTSRNLLILGERGVGKSALAREMSQYLRDKKGKPKLPFREINCAQLADTNSAISQLFGIEKNAGYRTGKGGTKGLVDTAMHGVLFLDEFFEAPTDVMRLLLRLLEERQFVRLGGARSLPWKGVIVAASNKYATVDDLDTAILEREIPADLIDRFFDPWVIPPLKDRRGEIWPLAQYLFLRLSKPHGGPVVRMDPADRARLRAMTLDWPGNVRSLERLMEAAIRRHRHSGRDKKALELSDDALRQYAMSHPRSPRPASVPDLSAWDSDGLKRIRQQQLVARLLHEMTEGSVSSVRSHWVGEQLRRIFGVSNVSEKLRSAGTSCKALAQTISRVQESLGG